MKHKAVESMVRAQFNIDNEIDVIVTFIAVVNGKYEFEVEWFDADIRYQSNFKLPHIDYKTQDMLEVI